MKSRLLVIAGVAAVLLTACEKKQEAQAPQPQVHQEESGTDRRVGGPGESPAESEAAPTVGEIREAQEETATLKEPEGQPPESGEKVAPTDPAMGGAEKKATAAEKKAEKKAAATPKSAAAEKPSAKGGGTGPETVVLANKNGDITLPHKAHAQITECKTCHGDKGPGKIDLDRDSGHKLCLGCHKEQGAGPTSCSGCHKKS